MCGISGVLDTQGTRTIWREPISRINDPQSHRGPEENDVLLELGLALVGHRRLSVAKGPPAIRVARELGIPVAYGIRASWENAAVDHSTAHEDSLRYRLTRALETRAIRKADHVFTRCEGLRSDIAARGIDAAKVTVIPNAVDTHSFQASQAPDPALKRSLSLDGKVVLGFVGSFYAYEGSICSSTPFLRFCRPTLPLPCCSWAAGPKRRAWGWKVMYARKSGRNSRQTAGRLSNPCATGATAWPTTNPSINGSPGRRCEHEGNGGIWLCCSRT